MPDDLVEMLISYCERGKCPHHDRQKAATSWLNKIKATGQVPEDSIKEMEFLREGVRLTREPRRFIDRVMAEVERIKCPAS